MRTITQRVESDVSRKAPQRVHQGAAVQRTVVPVAREIGSELIQRAMQPAATKVNRSTNFGYEDLVNSSRQVHGVAQAGFQGNAQPLPYLEAVQQSLGHHDVSHVRAYVDGRAAAVSGAIGARAYTSGESVAFAGTPDLYTAAHEAAHVVQQRSGLSLSRGLGDERDKYEQNADAVAKVVVQGGSSQSLLDEFAPSRMPAPPQVQRLYQPIVARAPSSAISIRDFIKLVEAEEARWPAVEQTQTALMITRLRKIFYGTSGWDEYLIPGRARISPGYSITEEETGREKLELFGPNADIRRTRQVVKDTSGLEPAIASQQEVRLEDGTFADIGHVLTGLDAANRPSVVAAPLGLATAKGNKAAVTWTGDLGSVLGEIVFYAFNHGMKPVADADAQRIVNEYASPQDMLGDIDAYVMASQYDTSDTAGKKVSELLRRYYLSAPATPDTVAREHRYSRFCALTGLRGWTGSASANETAWIDKWAPEVGAAAALYVGANTSGTLAIPGRLGVIAGIQWNPFARALLRLFLSALKSLIASEPP